MFKPENGGREAAAKIIIVITDGRSLNRSKTVQEAHFAKESGIKMLSIGVGFNVDNTELESIASDPSDEFFFFVNSFAVLDTIKESLATTTCKGTEC